MEEFPQKRLRSFKRRIDRLLKTLSSEWKKATKTFIFGLPNVNGKLCLRISVEMKNMNYFLNVSTSSCVKSWDDLQWNHNRVAFLNFDWTVAFFGKCFVVLTPPPKCFSFPICSLPLKEFSLWKGVDINISERLFQSRGTF